MAEQERFDAAVLGMGPGGEVAADRLLKAGKKVLVVEPELIGGECGYWACIPSKTLLRPVELAWSTAETPGVTTSSVVWEEARSWRDDMVRHHDDARQVQQYEEQGATVVRGAARIAGPGRIDVQGREFTTDQIVVATGSTARVPDIEGLDQCTVWTNREATNLREVPRRVVIIGAGPVAVETSQYLRGLGAEVTILARGRRLLGREEPRVSELALEHLRARGITVLLNTSAERAHRDGADSMLVLPDGTALAADAVVVATGRQPRTQDLGLESLSVVLDKETGAIEVDEHCAGGPGVWAVGDVTGIMEVTHVAKYQARVAVDTMLGRARSANYDAIPRVVFGHPEVAAVGLTREQAAEKMQVVAAEVDLTAALARPWTHEQEPSGQALGVLADRDRGVLVGAWAVAPHASEWIHQAALAIREQIPVERLLDQVAQFPTYSEGYLAALEDLEL
ncbi:NAD(P)/FAD-dependent oxidoreductase [Ornithinimicrobium faecis]|uniref:NAD(P)/FAD-dependent oxidoreductase n=1 Tax=Ornithinimicrobium faecis TaxID=2934158 RepID=A0ABY4YX27_9MICO|nr:NAD(P)/FAD-dependent oxidoreductase [Ornithinimicrobium sp. HY1793]USQ81284.1 NAD(P)/FAD-dependent oxidoreductase [Ornithinimicrobium sp. HY1793]